MFLILANYLIDDWSVSTETQYSEKNKRPYLKGRPYQF